MSNLNISVTENCIDQEWDDFINRLEYGSVYQKSSWNNLFADILGYGFRVIKIYKGGSLIGGLNISLNKRKIILPPLTPYNSIILNKSTRKFPGKKIKENNQILNSIIEYIQDQRLEIGHLVLDKNITDVRAFKWEGYKVTPKYTYEIPLDDLPDLLENRIYKSNVRKIKLKDKIDVKIVQDNQNKESCWNIWFDTYMGQNLVPPVKRDVFYRIYDYLESEKVISTYFAQVGQEPIAFRCGLHLPKSQTIHDWVAGSTREFQSEGANPKILWKIIEEFSAKGYQYIDLDGANKRNISQFKAGFGGELITYFEISSTTNIKQRIKNILPEFLIRRIKQMRNTASDD